MKGWTPQIWNILSNTDEMLANTISKKRVGNACFKEW